MAGLGRATVRDHPKLYPVCGRPSFTHRGRTISGHSRITQACAGADGLVTGYIRASGFNLVSSPARGDRRVIDVVLGGPTGAARDAYMQNLLTSSFTVLAGEARDQKLDIAEFISLPHFSASQQPPGAHPIARASRADLGG